jgi:CheY-like chemotaxis protein
MLAPVQLNSLIREMAELLRIPTAQRPIRYELGEPLPEIQADAAQIRQTLLNLTLNAIEATGSGDEPIVIGTAAETLDSTALGQLTFSADLAPGLYVRLSVTDRGVGMDERTLARAFEPFFSTKFAGRGLGLPAVQGIVRGHGGALSVTSAPGRGTTFRIWFPALGAAPRPRAATAAAAPERRALLVIDDDASVRTVARRLLEQMGFDVHTAADGPSGLDMLAAGIDGLAGVLVDLTMPRMTGDAVARAIHDRWPGTPVVLVSGYSAEAFAAQQAGLAVAGFVQKPFSRASLRSAVERLLGVENAGFGVR